MWVTMPHSRVRGLGCGPHCPTQKQGAQGKGITLQSRDTILLDRNPLSKAALKGRPGAHRSGGIPVGIPTREKQPPEGARGRKAPPVLDKGMDSHSRKWLGSQNYLHTRQAQKL